MGCDQSRARVQRRSEIADGCVARVDTTSKWGGAAPCQQRPPRITVRLPLSMSPSDSASALTDSRRCSSVQIFVQHVTLGNRIVLEDTSAASTILTGGITICSRYVHT